MRKQHYKDDHSDKNIWQIQEAKAKFSQLIKEVSTKGYQTITKQGEPVAIVISKQEFDKMTQPKTSLLDFFKAAPCQDIELKIKCSKDLPREIDL